jgi:signal transduction histidine kinase
MILTTPQRVSLTVPLLRGQSSHLEAKRGIRLAALRIPLVAKLVGANLLALGAAMTGWLLSGGVLNELAVAIFGLVVFAHLALVLAALGPIRDLEVVASRVWHGDFGARVEKSVVADDEVLRIGAMFNILLDGLVSDRARMRALATEVIAAGDRERAALARELHDSTAQRLAALLLQLSAATRDCTDPVLADRLADARDAAQELTEEVRLLSHTVHPRVLDDLGLAAALQKLARDSAAGTGVDVDVDVPMPLTDSRALPHGVAAVLYRVAQEAVRNAMRHGAPHRVSLVLRSDGRVVRLEVRDDGRGFDLADAERRRPGMGLSSMRERLALVDGWLDISTAVGDGTTLAASVPLAPGPAASC